MFVYKVNSEKEYFDLIIDLSKYGIHVPNQFANLDESGMSISDSFRLLTPEIIEDYLGVIDYEDDTEIEEMNDSLNRDKLHFSNRFQNDTPSDDDYPIIIMWEWNDNFDRLGKVITRYFDWISINKIKSSNNGKTIVRELYELWQNKYGEKYLELIELWEKNHHEEYSKK